MDMDRHAHIANQITEFLEGHYLQEDSMDCLGSLADWIAKNVWLTQELFWKKLKIEKKW